MLVALFIRVIVETGRLLGASLSPEQAAVLFLNGYRDRGGSPGEHPDSPEALRDLKRFLRVAYPPDLALPLYLAFRREQVRQQAWSRHGVP